MKNGKKEEEKMQKNAIAWYSQYQMHSYEIVKCESKVLSSIHNIIII